MRSPVRVIVTASRIPCQESHLVHLHTERSFLPVHGQRSLVLLKTRSLCADRQQNQRDLKDRPKAADQIHL